MITYNTSHHISASYIAHIWPGCACHPSIRGETSANYIRGFGLRTGLLRFLAFILRAMNGCHLTTIPTNVLSLPGLWCLEKIQTCCCGHGHGILLYAHVSATRLHICQLHSLLYYILSLAGSSVQTLQCNGFPLHSMTTTISVQINVRAESF